MVLLAVMLVAGSWPVSAGAAVTNSVDSGEAAGDSAAASKETDGVTGGNADSADASDVSGNTGSADASDDRTDTGSADASDVSGNIDSADTSGDGADTSGDGAETDGADVSGAGEGKRTEEESAEEESADDSDGESTDESEDAEDGADLLEDEEEVDLSGILNGAETGTIRTGVYSIATAADPSYVLAAENDSVAFKSNISLSLNEGKQSELFYVAALGSGKYRIENLNSGCVFDCAGGKSDKGTNIQQYRVNSTPAQTFKITETKSGLYTIGATHCSLVLDVANGLAAEKSNVRLWKSNGTPAQQWIFTKVMDPMPQGLYYITSSASGKVMQVAGGSYSRKANIEVGNKTGAVSQRFLVETKNGGATYTIRNLYSRLTLDVESGSTASGANIWQYRVNGTAAQTFRITPLLNGTYRISAMSGSLPLCVSGSNVCQMTLTNAQNASQTWTFSDAPADPAAGMYRILSAKNPAMGLDICGGDWNIRPNVQLYTQTTSASQVNQQFMLDKAGDGIFTITNVGSGKVLDKAGGAETMSNENVQQYRANGTSAQTWRFEPTGDGDGSYYIINGVGTYLDVKGGTMANGTNVQAHKGNGTAAQKWYLEPTAFSGTGWRTVNTYERSYYKNGTKLTGWQKIGSYYYFFNSGGVMLYNCEYGGWQLDSCGRRYAVTAAQLLSSVKPGGKTLKNLIQNAMIPCGRVLYIWGGGWGDSDGSKIGYLPSWGTFFKAHATSTYNRNNYRYSYGSGLDCSGYMAWVVYNTEFTANNQFSILYQGSSTYTSTSLALRIASLGYASYKSGAIGAFTDLKPGDIVSMNGHIWMYLGSCSDGSGVIIHSSPMGQTYGGGVQIAGTPDRNGNTNSEGYWLAKAYMQKYFPDWPYPAYSCSVGYRSTAVGYARWRNDPDGLQKMSAQQVLQTILGAA